MNCICIDAYRTDPEAKQIADALMERAGVTADVVVGIERRGNIWYLDTLALREDGKFLLVDDDVVHVVVEVPA